jgi:proteic killer suppression protein
MIKGFKHKGLKLFFEAGKASGINPNHQKRIKNILALLETAETIEDMNLPGLKLHELKGRRKGTWAVMVSGNWRITFQFADGDVIEVNYEDYHQ